MITANSAELEQVIEYHMAFSAPTLYGAQVSKRNLAYGFFCTLYY